LSMESKYEYSEKSSTVVLSLPANNQLEGASVALRFFQMACALYVFLSVTESFQSKITYDDRLSQIRPLVGSLCLTSDCCR
jgi:hypothetical protein